MRKMDLKASKAFALIHFGVLMNQTVDVSESLPGKKVFF